MKFITHTNIRIDSALIHSLLSFVVVAALLYLLNFELKGSIILLVLSMFFAGLFGWLFSDWLIPIADEKWLFEPFILTPIVALFSALLACIIFGVIHEFSPWNNGDAEIMKAIGGGVFMGAYGFILSLPFSIITGILIGKYLYKSGKYSN